MQGVDRTLKTLLLPGLDGTGRLFEPLLDQLSRTLSAQVVSFPPDRLDDYNELQQEIEQSLPRDRPFAIVAESFSCPLAIRIASASPAGLIGVVLVGGFLSRPIGVLSPLLRGLTSPWQFRPTPPAFLIRHLLLARGTPDLVLRDVIRAVRTVTPNILAARVRQALSVDVSEEFARCKTPLLVIEGAQDRLLSRSTAERMRAVRPDAQFETIDAPHLILQCRPREAALRIERFLVGEGGGADQKR